MVNRLTSVSLVFRSILIIGFSCSLAFSCANIIEENNNPAGSDSGNESSLSGNSRTLADLPVDVYVAGSLTFGNNTYGGYWQADQNAFELVQLTNATIIYDLIIENGEIYAVGKNKQDKAAIWRNGVIEELTSPTGVSPTAYWATGIDTHDGDIYISGVYSYDNDGSSASASIYWKNGDVTTLTSTVDSEALDIAYHDGKAVTVGWYKNGTYIYPCYWEDNQRKILHASGDGKAYQVESGENDFYIAGWTASGNSTTSARASLWIDGKDTTRLGKGQRYNHIGEAQYSKGLGMAISGEQIYIAGESYYFNLGSSPAYWEGGAIREPYKNFGGSSDDVVVGMISAIAVFDGHVFTAGVIDGDLSNEDWDPTEPSVWLNGVRYSLSRDGLTNAQAESILLVPR